jgi:glycosyltransferase involved in cell wall biosynthesis
MIWSALKNKFYDIYLRNIQKNKNKILFRRYSEDIKIIKEYNLLDGNQYLQRYPDVARAQIDPVVHYVLYGFKEGRTPNLRVNCLKRPDTVLSAQAPDKIQELVRKYGLFDSDLYLLQNPDVAQLNIYPLDHYILHGLKEGRRLYPEFRLSNMIQDQINEAVQYEPRVAHIPGIGPNLLAPFFDPLYFLHKGIKERLRATNYDTIMCVPFIRIGGAEHYSGQFAHALRRLRPNETILLLRTETDHFERPEWFPEGIDTVDLSDLFAQIDSEDAERLLNVMFLGLNPSRIVNINSRTCWQVFKRFGKQLSDWTNLYGFFFGWDLNDRGVRVGYPSDYYPHTGGFMSAICTDANYIKQELIKLYAVPPLLQERIIQLFKPVEYPADKPTVAERASVSRHLRPRPIVLWAGRLDRQKRFDLVQGIAARMPHVDFYCWGNVVLDGPLDLSHCPTNVTLRPAFKSLNELPLADADVWLFTSAWEGTPTILIELAMKGIPVVASAVGGVPELINCDTGWPIESIDEVEAYVASLNEALDNPDLRVKRALNLQQLATSRHSKEKFDADIQRILAQEKRYD